MKVERATPSLAFTRTPYYTRTSLPHAQPLRCSVRWASTAYAVAPNSGSLCACLCELGCDLAVAAAEPKAKGWFHLLAAKKVEEDFASTPMTSPTAN